MAFTPAEEVLGSAPKRSSFTPFDDAQASLATSQSLLDNAFYNPQKNILEGKASENVDVLKGAGKQALSTLSMAGAHRAGPVGQQMLASAPEFAKQLQGFDENLQPSNAAQGQGAVMTSIGETIAPVGPLANEIQGAGLLKKAAKKTGLTKYLSERAAKRATDAVASTEETMTKGERLAAIAEGRMKPTLTGGGAFVPSETEANAGKILASNLKRNPVKNVPIIQQQIGKRGKAAETYLEQNLQPITNAEDFGAFAAKRTEMAKYSTEAEMKAYDEQIKMFQKQVLGRGGYNTANYYKALKEYEANVTSRLPKGKEALLTETGSAKLQAAKDVRSVVRDMIGEKNPEFKSQMYDLASLYDALDNTIAKAEKVDKSGLREFAKRHPYITGGAVFAGGETLYSKARQALGI